MQKKLIEKRKRVKEFIQIVKDNDGKLYGVDRKFTNWRLDRLAKKGISYEMVKL